MMMLRKIAFVLEDFTVGAPGQQLLDRFLIGYFRDGEFRRIPDLQVAVWLAPAAESSTAFAAATTNIALRQRDFKLAQFGNLAAAVNDAEAVIVAAPADRVAVAESLLRNVLEQVPAGARCFIHGCLGANFATAERLVSLAAARKLAISSGTSMSTAFRLPEMEIKEGTLLSEGLIVVQGAPPVAELSGIEGLLPVISRRSGGEAGLRSVRRFGGRGLWRTVADGAWGPLLAAAISRSNTTQGDPVRDGRTQDLVGKDLVRKLARNPRGWILEHRDGFRSVILVLDGVVADCTFAVRSGDGVIACAQLYRPPAPNRSEFDRLAGTLEDFFRSGIAWPVERSLLVARFMEDVVG